MNNNGNLTKQLCSIHGIQFIQAGPHLFCSQCLLHEADKRSTEKAVFSKKHDKQNDIATYKKLGIPRRHFSSSFENYELEYTVQKFSCDLLIDFVSNFNKKKCGNLIMLGREGTGKTHLACAILKLLWQKGMRVRYINSFDLCSLFVENWKNTNFYERNEIDNFASYDLLVIDEYGLYDQNERHKNYVDRVLLKRYEEKKPTIIISNLIKEQFISNVGFRLWSRLNEDELNVLEFMWHDYRISKNG